MKLLVLALVAGLCFAQPSAPLEMLLGRWAGRGPNGGLVEIHAGRENKEIIGRAKPRTPGAQWEADDDDLSGRRDGSGGFL